MPPPIPQTTFQVYPNSSSNDNLQSSPSNMITSAQYNPNALNSYGHPGEIVYGSMVENNNDVCFRIVPLITLQKYIIILFFFSFLFIILFDILIVEKQ